MKIQNEDCGLHGAGIGDRIEVFGETTHTCGYTIDIANEFIFLCGEFGGNEMTSDGRLLHIVDLAHNYTCPNCQHPFDQISMICDLEKDTVIKEITIKF